MLLPRRFAPGGLSRDIHSQLRMATDFRRILVVFGDRRIGMLS